MQENPRISKEIAIELDAYKNKVINRTLLLGLVVGFLVVLVSVIGRQSEGIVFWHHVANISALAAFTIVYFLRKNVHIRLKIALVIAIIFYIVTIDTLKHGAFSISVMSILIPFLALFAFSFRTSLITYLAIMALFLGLGLLVVNGYISIHTNASDRQYIFEVWVIRALILTLTATIIIYFTNEFNNKLSSLLAESKLYSQSVQQSEAILKGLFESTDDIVGFFDRELRLQLYNNAFAAYARKTDSIALKRDMDVLGEMDKRKADVFREFLGKALQGEKFQHPMSYPSLDGKEFHFLMSYNPVYQGGQIIGVSMFVKDITLLKEAEKEVKAERDFSNKLLESFPGIFFLYELSDEPTLVQWNKNNEYLLGFSAEELLGQPFYKFASAEDTKALTEAIKQLSKDGELLTTVNVLKKNGDSVPFLIQAKTYQTKDGNYFFGFGIDITDRIAAQAALESANQELEKKVGERTQELETANEELTSSNEELMTQRESLENSLKQLKETQDQLIHAEKMASLGLLSAGVAHEINNPLNFIQGSVSGLRKYLIRTNSEMVTETKPFLDIMQEGVSRASAIVKSLNHFSRQESNAADRCNLVQVLDNCLVMLQNRFKHRVEVVKELPHEPFLVKGNEGKMHQVLLNILSNAEQAINSENGKVYIQGVLNSESLKLRITDNGVGISPENLSKVTDPFFTTKPPGKGTGLGLSITYRILQDMNGRISFESSQGEDHGTSVILDLPIVLDKA